MIYILIVTTFLVSTSLTKYLSLSTSRLSSMDTPNARSLHTIPTPIGGGIAILTALIIPTVYLHLPLYGLMMGILLLAGIAFIDDHHPLPALYRFIVQGIAAYCLLQDFSFWHDVNIVYVSIAFFSIIWMINLYNFMDGMDGFAGGMAVIGFGTFAILGGLAEHTLFMNMNLMIASAAGGFLVFNFPPAKIFMGDVGSSCLGFLVAGFSLWGIQENIFSLWVAVLLFSPFIVDATVTLLHRMLKREKVWQAHKSHYYQRVVTLGWGHQRTVLLEYVLMLSCSMSALLATSILPFFEIWCLVWGGIYLLLMFAVYRLE